MINLGIVVVYLVPAPYERMLQLHLGQISRHTRVPYSIFGCAVRSSPKALDLLRSESRVRLIQCSPTTATGPEEHSHYLDQLTRCAIDSDVSHVVTLHVDSFPIHDRWVEGMLAEISDHCPIVTGTRVDSGCMMFTREFYVRCQPRFLPTAEEQSRVGFARCVNDWDVVPHSGTGYAFRAYLEGLRVHFIPRVTPPDSIATIYDQRVFHLGQGFVSLPSSAAESRGDHWVRRALFESVGYVARAVFRPKARRFLRRRIGPAAMSHFDRARDEARIASVRKEMGDALANPDDYLVRLLNRLAPA